MVWLEMGRSDTTSRVSPVWLFFPYHIKMSMDFIYSWATNSNASSLCVSSFLTDTSRYGGWSSSFWSKSCKTTSPTRTIYVTKVIAASRFTYWKLSLKWFNFKKTDQLMMLNTDEPTASLVQCKEELRYFKWLMLSYINVYFKWILNNI